jgi:hypothetical protein
MSGKSRVGVVAALILALVVAATAGMWLWLKSSLRSEVYRTLDRIERDSKGAVKVKVGDLSVDPILRRATLRDVTIDLKSPQGTPVTLRVDTLDVKKWEQLGDGSNLLREQALEWHGLRSPELDAQLTQASGLLKKVIGDALVFDVVHRVSYRPERDNEFELDATVTCAKLGQLTLHLSATGIDLRQLNQVARDRQARGRPPALDAEMRNRAMAAVAGAKLQGARLAVRNTRLFDAIVAIEASRAGVSTEQARRNVQEQVRQKCGAPLAEPWTKRICPALTSFLDSPKSLSLTLAPAKPVALSGVAIAALSNGPGAAIEQLGLNLTANEEK